MDKYYYKLLDREANAEGKNTELEDRNHESNLENIVVPEKWRSQIEKVSYLLMEQY